MKKIVSYSYFRHAASCYEKEKGNAAKQFEQFLGLLVRAHHMLWKGFEMRISHDDEVTKLPYFKTLVALNYEGLIHLVFHGKAKTLCGEGGMLERLRPAFEEELEAVICRDIDVIPSPRDRRSVEDWLTSWRAIHCLHYAGAHSGIMGGTTSVRPKKFKELIGCDTFEQFIERGKSAGITMNAHGDDQHLLNRHHSLLCKDMLLHDLHHQVGDMPASDIRTEISSPMPEDVPKRVAEEGDRCSPGIGLCADPGPALSFYDSLDDPIIKTIQRLEKDAKL